MWRPPTLIPDPETMRALRDDLRVSLALLTRLPVPLPPETDPTRGARAMWAYPLVGAVIGVSGGVLAALLMLLGVSGTLAAALGLTAMVLMTGALHEDGLADTADGLGPLVPAERRLEIMRDSTVGAFGAVAIALALLSRWAGYSGFDPTQMLLAFTAAAAVSRSGLAWLCYQFPMARSDGLAARAGQPPRKTVLISLTLGLAICLLCVGLPGLLVATLAVIATLPVARIAQKKIGGLTGDILGAAQQCSEIAALVALTIFL